MVSKEIYTAGKYYFINTQVFDLQNILVFRQEDSYTLTLSGFQFTPDSTDSVLVAGEAGSCNENYINDFR